MRTIAAVSLALLLLAIAPAAARDLTIPDPELTPGVATDATLETICGTKWGKDVRHVTPAMKRERFTAYGIQCKPLFKGSRLQACGKWEIDHCISRELGGADDVRNLWPQSYSGGWNARDKDRLENELHKRLCHGELSLADAQKRICGDWRDAYREIFGEPKSTRRK
jgi:hypothetical protein